MRDHQRKTHLGILLVLLLWENLASFLTPVPVAAFLVHPITYPATNSVCRPSTWTKHKAVNNNNQKEDGKNQNDNILQETSSIQVLQYFENRWNEAQPIELRLDVTITSCFELARFLLFDLTLPKKDVPQFEIEDVIMLANVFSSILTLAFLWTVAGLVTKLFEDEAIYTNWARLAKTTVMAGPLWLAVEILFQWPPSVDILYNGSVMDAAITLLTGCVGLFATVGIARIAPRFLL